MRAECPLWIGIRNGGLTEAFAIAFGQEIAGDEDGDVPGPSLMDYFMPTAVEIPASRFET